MLSIGSPAFAQTGNINPNVIEIDQSANLYPLSVIGAANNGPILNPNGAGSYVDWVKDSSNNTDPPSLIDSVALGIDTSGTITGIPNGAAAVNGPSGHWYGARIVDSVSSGIVKDQDIFLTGSKETDDPSTWNVGPGSIGAPKYDITEAYLANNQQTLFFAAERRGNNGTTAFDVDSTSMRPLPPTSRSGPRAICSSHSRSRAMAR
jgi:hypothetical protein